MKIGLKGSVNNKIEEFAEEVNKANVDFVICTGDFGFYPELQYIDWYDLGKIINDYANHSEMDICDIKLLSILCDKTEEEIIKMSKG